MSDHQIKRFDVEGNSEKFRKNSKDPKERAVRSGTDVVTEDLNRVIIDPYEASCTVKTVTSGGIGT